MSNEDIQRLLVVQGEIAEIGDITLPAGTPHGFALKLADGGLVTILGLSREQVRTLVPLYYEDTTQITFGVPQATGAPNEQ